jgi:DNA polymerase-3 subunit epsilon
VTKVGNPNGPLAGEVIVFTGALLMPRREAAELAAQNGCAVADAVTKKTSVLVVGDQDIRRLAGHEKSSKHRKAEQLLAEGHPLRILGEADFLALLNIG